MKRISLRFLRAAPILLVAVGAICLLSQDANAQGCRYGGGYGGGYSSGYYGGHGGGHGGYYGGHSSYYGGSSLNIQLGNGYRNFSYGYRPIYTGPVWHDTTHYDYHPGQVVPHGNHLDYVPGHYDLHRSGHWDH